MKRIYPDRDLCIGCGLCVLGCLSAHSKSHDLVLAFKEERAKGLVSRKRLIEDDEVCVAISCRHCEEPECVSACISGALTKDEETGLTVYDADKCVGCWTCLMACPYGVIQRDKYNNKIVKCDLCAGRENGPACVEACPNRALKYEERRSDQNFASEKIIYADTANCGSVPLIEGMDGAGIYDLGAEGASTLLNEAAADIKRAVVLGGSIEGLNIAELLHNRGVEVAVVESGLRILGAVCDAVSAGMIAKRMQEAGVLIRCGAAAKKVVHGKDAGLRGVLLEDKSFLEAGAVAVSGTDYCKVLSMSSISSFGLPTISVGEVNPDLANPDYESVSFFDEPKQSYRKLVFKKDQLVGYVLVGDIDFAGMYTSFIKFKFKVDAQTRKRLSEGEPDVLMWPDEFFNKAWNPET